MPLAAGPPWISSCANASTRLSACRHMPGAQPIPPPWRHTSRDGTPRRRAPHYPAEEAVSPVAPARLLDIFRLSFMKTLIQKVLVAFVGSALVLLKAQAVVGVSVSIGTLQPAESVTVSYEVTIDSPITPGVTQISSQG